MQEWRHHDKQKNLYERNSYPLKQGTGREAVRLSQQPGVSVVQIAEELGVSDHSLYKWRKQAQERGEYPFPGNGKIALTAEQEENRTLEERTRAGQTGARHSRNRRRWILRVIKHVRYAFMKELRSRVGSAA